MASEELDWLQEMMRLSGVEQEPEEEDGYPLIFPGMLLEEEEEEERLLWEKLRLAEEQTLELARQQEAMRDEAGTDTR